MSERSKLLLEAMASADNVAAAVFHRHPHDDIEARALLAVAHALCAIADALEMLVSER